MTRARIEWTAGTTAAIYVAIGAMLRKTSATFAMTFEMEISKMLAPTEATSAMTGAIGGMTAETCDATDEIFGRTAGSSWLTLDALFGECSPEQKPRKTADLEWSRASGPAALMQLVRLDQLPDIVLNFPRPVQAGFLHRDSTY